MAGGISAASGEAPITKVNRSDDRNELGRFQDETWPRTKDSASELQDDSLWMKADKLLLSDENQKADIEMLRKVLSDIKASSSW